ncbi:PTS ascorbate transporter subunit IIB [Aquibacillus halophilus]|uniref:PTS ascorbate transporter subunit IIB n=1 Tax=Aquibacillus halophilus TaxID=930132 RepID=A0A6A8DR79_9BACI|nr:PTS sugar transporter subunit IIB [Aquibacillus halophilus]MRH43712.1 PTS ascorbate transporter subunit IIB [Aquibacillus halophilus]
MKIITVCGMGLGTSLMLKMTVERVLQAKGIKGEVEAIDIGSAASANADLIVTNHEFVKELQGTKAKVVAIKNIASEKEVAEALAEVLGE